MEKVDVMERISPEEIKEEMRTMEFVAGGSLIEGISGTGAMALAIIGLAGVLSPLMLAVSTILIGVGLMFEGGSIGARFSRLVSETNAGRLGTYVMGGGMTAEFLGGVAGVVLGILSILGVFPGILVPVAAIAFGGALIMGTGVSARLNNLQIAKYCDLKEARHVARAFVRTAEGVEVLFGLGSIVLGVLAVVGLAPMILSLVAMLAVGFSNLTTGTAITGRALSSFHCV